MTSPPSLFGRLRPAAAAVIAHSRAWRALLFVLIAVVSYLALSPKPPPGVDLGWDKLNHALAFTTLAFAASLGQPGPLRTRLVWLAGLLAFGGLIEILQLFVPGRSAEWADLLADAVGIALGAVVAVGVLRAVEWPPGRSAGP
jgi:VanZ family protein